MLTAAELASATGSEEATVKRLAELLTTAHPADIPLVVR
jgi:hypothetical protein